MAIRARLTAPRETREEWPWHSVESLSLPASTVFGGERRMEAENFLSPGFSIRHAFRQKTDGWLPFSSAASVTQPSRLKGISVSPEHGTGYLSATQVYDLRPVPRRFLSNARTSELDSRFLDDEVILVTRSGSVGRATVSGRSLNGFMISDDLLRIVPRSPDDWGWLYGYLRSPTARAMMTSAQYGHVIKHLEVSHLDSLPYVVPSVSTKSEFNALLRDALNSRNRAHDLVLQAEDKYKTEIGPLPDLTDGTNGFEASTRNIFGAGRRFEGNYHNPVARAAEQAVTQNGYRIEKLKDLVERVFIPGRFKHVYGPEGRPYLDSAQILEISPDIEKRVLSLDAERRAGYLVESGTLLLPCSGQLHGIIGSVVLAGEWHENKVLTNHILRIVPKEIPTIRIGYLQAVLSHPQLGRPRVLRGAYGSSVPELSVPDIENMTVPRLPPKVEDAIADNMEEAAGLMAHANSVEDEIADKAEKIVRSFLG